MVHNKALSVSATAPQRAISACHPTSTQHSHPSKYTFLSFTSYSNNKLDFLNIIFESQSYRHNRFCRTTENRAMVSHVCIRGTATPVATFRLRRRPIYCGPVLNPARFVFKVSRKFVNSQIYQINRERANRKSIQNGALLLLEIVNRVILI